MANQSMENCERPTRTRSSPASDCVRAVKINAAQASHLGRIARECLACASAARGGEVCIRQTASPKERPSVAHAADSGTASLRSPASTCSGCVSGRLKSCLSAGLSEEAATPEFLRTRRSASPKTLPPVHPREPAAAACFSATARRLSPLTLAMSALCDKAPQGRKRKLVHRCAETVEFGTSLWKEKEKAGQSVMWGGHSCPPCLFVGRTLLSAKGSNRSGLLQLHR